MQDRSVKQVEARSVQESANIHKTVRVVKQHVEREKTAEGSETCEFMQNIDEKRVLLDCEGVGITPGLDTYDTSTCPASAARPMRCEHCVRGTPTNYRFSSFTCLGGWCLYICEFPVTIFCETKFLNESRACRFETYAQVHLL